VIIGFRDPETEKVFQNTVSRKFPASIQTTALRKLLQQA
jgi:plasmid maintenance system killer protein